MLLDIDSMKSVHLTGGRRFTFKSGKKETLHNLPLALGWDYTMPKAFKAGTTCFHSTKR